MTGDGLQDLVLLRNGNVAYWPNLGLRPVGRAGDDAATRRGCRTATTRAGCCSATSTATALADLVYVDRGRVLLWGNQSGNAWTAAAGRRSPAPRTWSTPTRSQLADLHGTGMAGLLCQPGRRRLRAADWRFLDFTGGVKPHLLTGMDNHLGATTRSPTRPSTAGVPARPGATRRPGGGPRCRSRCTWSSRVEVIDAHLRRPADHRVPLPPRLLGRRGAGVPRLRHGRAARHRNLRPRAGRRPGCGPPRAHYSPPTLTRSWFHPGPVAAAEAGDWTELDLRHEYWAGDPPMLARPAAS